MERDNDLLRGEVRSIKSGEKASSENIQQLLTVARLDLDQKFNELNQKNKELDRLRKKIEDLQVSADNLIQFAMFLYSKVLSVLSVR